MRLTILSILFLVPILLHAQDAKKSIFFNNTELGYFIGSDYRRILTAQGNTSNSAVTHTLSLRSVNGWYLSPKISLGIGVGFDGLIIRPSEYILPGGNSFNLAIRPGTYYRTLPLYADLRYYFKDKARSYFLYGNLGSSIPINHNFEKGKMWGLGFGYKFDLSMRTYLNISFGFKEQFIKTTPEDLQHIPSVGFKVGLMFY